MVIEYIAISYLLNFIIIGSLAKKILKYLIIPFVLFNIYDFYLYGDASFGNIPTIVEFFIFIVFIIYFLFEKMKLSYQEPVYSSISFWICVGLFVYFTGNFFYILLVINSTPDDKNELIIIYSFVTIIKNIILGLSLLKNEDSILQKNNISIPNDFILENFTYKPPLN